MIWIDRLNSFSPFDYVAVFLFVGGWLWIDWRIEKSVHPRQSVSNLMDEFRKVWLREMVTREPRIFDAQLVANFRQGATFFASGTMIAIGGSLALIGNTEQLVGIASDLTLNSAPVFVWEIKILLVLLFLSNSFLKYVWAHRLFGYCSVLMGAVPNDRDDPLAYPRTEQAADICNSAARSFNRGMRATYFSLTAVAWLAGALPLIIATVVTVSVLLRREFASQSRVALLRVPPNTSN